MQRGNREGAARIVRPGDDRLTVVPDGSRIGKTLGRCGAGLCLLLCLAVNATAAGTRDNLFSSELLGSRGDRVAPRVLGTNQTGPAATGEIVGGREDGAGVTSGYGALTLPVHRRFALDVEGLAYHSGDDRFSGLGAHAYWRNPKWGLLGITASRSTADIAAYDGIPALTGIRSDTYGVEAEAYLGPATLALQAGRIISDLDTYDHKHYAAFDVQWWASRRWYWVGGTRRIAGSATNRLETGYTAAVAGVPVTIYGGGTWDAFRGEYLGAEVVPWGGAKSHWVVFAEADRGQDGYSAGFVGLRYDYGPVQNAPLISLFDRVTGGF